MGKKSNPLLAPINIEPLTASFGLFQIVFADLTECFAIALFRLKQHEDQTLTLQQVFKRNFSEILEELKDQLKQLEPTPISPKRAVLSELKELKKARERAAELNHWRNERIHARVRYYNDVYILHNNKTGKRLAMEGCREKPDEALKLVGDVEGNIAALEGFIKHRKAFREALSGEAPASKNAPHTIKCSGEITFHKG